MSIFSKLDTDNVKNSTDTLGGYTPLDSDIYEAVIRAAYVTVSPSGAMAVNLIAEINDKEYREQLWVTNREGKPYYISKKNGEKVSLPGYTTINDICLCTVGKELKEVETEPRTFKIYDFEQKQEVLKEVPTIVELQNMVVNLGIIHEVQDKNVKDASGNYVPSGETRDVNTINKVFHTSSHRTVNEAREGKKEAAFYDKWLKQNKGVIRNRAKGAASTPEGKDASELKKPAKSLFN